MAQPNHYATLDVHRNALPSQIRAAYRKLAMQRHPDRAEGNAERFSELQEAYNVLSDPEARRAYDATLRTPGEAPERRVTMTYEQAMRLRRSRQLVRNVLTEKGWVTP